VEALGFDAPGKFSILSPLEPPVPSVSSCS
jgi:hypothetical protein